MRPGHFEMKAKVLKLLRRNGKYLSESHKLKLSSVSCLKQYILRPHSRIRAHSKGFNEEINGKRTY